MNTEAKREFGAILERLKGVAGDLSSSTQGYNDHGELDAVERTIADEAHSLLCEACDELRKLR